LALDVVPLEDRKNSLLNRREVKALLKNACGKIKRSDASNIIAQTYNIDSKKIIPVSLTCETGKTDVHATFYIYDNEEEAKKQLPRYRLLRTMPKEERKKILDDEKAAKLKAKQAAAAEAKSGARK